MQYSLARSISLLRTTLSPLRSARPCSAISISTRASRQLPRPVFPSFSDMSNRGYDLFNYTSGRWLVNEDVRLAERACKFNDNELRHLAAQSVGRTFQDVDSMVKLDEGGFNRIFLITMHDGFWMIEKHERIAVPLGRPLCIAFSRP
ncbi:hypothetical protein C2E23DRAFT_848500 [Lenzites betulinus]|nr:hypothetical protein C2E23DRAFT_848500 [Lenzites betulinus]